MRKILYHFIVGCLYIMSCWVSGIIAKDQEIKLQWPVKTQSKLQISSTFGESRIDHFHNGLDLPGENLQVRPVKKGRLIWYTRGKNKQGEVPFGGGGTVILAHENFHSGYMHLKSIKSALITKQQISENKTLGVSGNTGHSGGAHIHFFIYSSRFKKYYNPLLTLSNEYYRDEKPPSVVDYGILIDNKIVRVNFKKAIIMSKEFPIYAQFKDHGIAKERWGLYQLKASNNFSKKEFLYHIKFDFIQFKNNRWVTSNELSFDTVYHQDWYYIGNNFKKTKKIYWFAKGFKGPTSSEKISFKIREP